MYWSNFQVRIVGVFLGGINLLRASIVLRHEISFGGACYTEVKCQHICCFSFDGYTGSRLKGNASICLPERRRGC